MLSRNKNVHIFTISLIFMIILSILSQQPARAAGIRYAKPAASGTGTCLSWANACILQDALTGAGRNDEIWVAQGTHKPTDLLDRAATFQLKDGVGVYGGFKGNETLRTQRNPSLYVTILSGDIGTIGDTSNNSYHVVTGATGATLDGFTITAGNAEGMMSNNCGGGMYNHDSSPTLANIIFSSNSAPNNGGGMFNDGSSPTLTDITFQENSADNGGGMANWSNSDPVLTDVSFTGNSAIYGAGIYSYESSPTLTSVSFSTNTASQKGGGMYNDSSNPELTIVTFSENSAIHGGGIFNFDNSSPTLTDVSFSNNTAVSFGGGMYNSSSSPTLTGVTFSGNAAATGGGTYNSLSSPMLADVTFSGNSANSGGGMENINASSPTLINVTFDTNTVTAYGGGMDNVGSSPTLTNVTFDANSANHGGGMYNEDSDPILINATFSGNAALIEGGGMNNYDASSPTLTNVTFSGNTAITNGGGIRNNANSDPTIRNTILWGNTAPDGAQVFNLDVDSIPVVSDSVVQGGYAGGTNIITTDPMLGTLGDHGGTTQTIPLQAGSSAIDAGNDGVCPADDQRGTARPQGAQCDIGAYEYVDTTKPVVNTFTATTPSNSLNIPVATFTASDDVAVTGYIISTSSTPPTAGGAGWTASAPGTYTVPSDGTYTLYPWAKDASGNVSAVFGSPRTVVVDATQPVVNTFTATTPTNNLDIPITAFTASDAGGVTGYMITTSSTPPTSGSAGWTGTAPTTFTVAADGFYTLYPWAKDATGNVSVVFGSPRSVTVDTVQPVVNTFSVPTPSNSLNIPISAFSASDNMAVAGYKITTSATPPTAGSGGWTASAPTTFTVGANGFYTLYPWARDAAGNVSEIFGSPRTVEVQAATPTSTSTSTRTPTRTLTRTATRTPTSSPTRSPSPSPTRTLTRTMTATTTRTPTPSPTTTPSPSPTRTRTTTASTTPSRTLTRTMTPTATRTPTGEGYRVFLPQVLKEIIVP
jgi:predicted outer membrane repeat protein